MGRIKKHRPGDKTCPCNDCQSKLNQIEKISEGSLRFMSQVMSVTNRFNNLLGDTLAKLRSEFHLQEQTSKKSIRRVSSPRKKKGA